MPICNCKPNSSGIHSYACAMSQPPAAPSMGWTCPSCSRNNSPLVQTCSCSKTEDRGTPRRLLTEGPISVTMTEVN